MWWKHFLNWSFLILGVSFVQPWVAITILEVIIFLNSFRVSCIYYSYIYVLSLYNHSNKIKSNKMCCIYDTFIKCRINVLGYKRKKNNGSDSWNHIYLSKNLRLFEYGNCQSFVFCYYCSKCTEHLLERMFLSSWVVYCFNVIYASNVVLEATQWGLFIWAQMI